MYDITVDVDGVLLDIHTRMSQMFADKDYVFDINNVYTYDFNQSLSDISDCPELPPLPMIYEMLNDPWLYSTAPVDWDSIELIRRLSEKGYKFHIYTVSGNTDVYLAKQVMLSHWFSFSPNVAIESIIDSESYSKKSCNTIAVIEDSHINLREYGADVHKFLINKPYNGERYNWAFADVFEDKKLKRCDRTYDAILDAVDCIDKVR